MQLMLTDFKTCIKVCTSTFQYIDGGLAHNSLVSTIMMFIHCKYKKSGITDIYLGRSTSNTSLAVSMLWYPISSEGTGTDGPP
jgi:hypothetical protein